VDDFDGRVAVVTGAGSGIGRAVAHRLGTAGMRVVAADIEPAALDRTVGELHAAGVDAVGRVTDVGRWPEIESLAALTMETYGAVHVVHNNAGVVTAGPIEDLTLDDWKWVLGVDLWSVIYGVRAFLPLIKAAGEGHIVNTASTAGLQASPGIAPYNVAKFGVVALTETLARELADTPSINASVLCPGAVNTRIVESERNRPDDLTDHHQTAVDDRFKERSAAMLAKGMDPAAVADLVHDAIATNRFWIITHDPWKQVMVDRAAALATDGSLFTGFGG
jgi:NAD(P)-dependent dehydrogenase (short-subunit alcohol dehydrogenase family)